MKIEFSVEERQLILQWAGDAWKATDRARMLTRPDSQDERIALEYQQEIELLQAKLK